MKEKKTKTSKKQREEQQAKKDAVRKKIMLDDLNERVATEQAGEEQDPNRIAEAAVEKAAEDLEREIEYAHRFYSCHLDKKLNLVISPDNLSIIEILREMGFYRFDQPGGGSEYVRIADGKIRLIKDTQQIIDAFEDYVSELPPRVIELIVKDDYVEQYTIDSNMLLRQFYKNIMYYFSSTLPRLRPQSGEEISILHDSRQVKFFFYNNVAVAVTPKGRRIIPYNKLQQELQALSREFGNIDGKYIWESSILNRNYKEDIQLGDFERFCQFICGYAGSNGGEIYQKRMMSLQSIFGYLMHDNYETNLKSILFIDVNKDGNGKPAGGTGKGIIGKALAQMLNRSESDCKYICVGGKGFDPTDERRYAAGDLTTQLAHIEDISTRFNFNDFYNDVTDGATFRKMYQDKTVHRIKTMLSSNQPIALSGSSNKRRLVVFELDNYFDARRTPQDVFGRRFFESEWTEDDWAQFDNFMIRCCELYMSCKSTIGIIEPPLINYQEQLLRASLSEDFIVWFKSKIDPYVAHNESHAFIKTVLFDEFVHKYTEFQSREKYGRAFTTWCQKYLEIMEIPSGEKRSTQDLLILYPPKNDPAIKMIVK